MSDEPSKLREVKNATTEQVREEFDKHVTFIQQQGNKNLEFALMVTGHDKGNDDFYTYSMLGGPPDTLAVVVMGLMDELVKRDPSLAIFFIGNFMQRMQKTQLEDLINSLQSGTPPNKNIH